MLLYTPAISAQTALAEVAPAMSAALDSVAGQYQLHLPDSATLTRRSHFGYCGQGPSFCGSESSSISPSSSDSTPVLASSTYLVSSQTSMVTPTPSGEPQRVGNFTYSPLPSGTTASAAATPTGLGDTYTLYTGNGTTAQNWPDQRCWVDFDTMYARKGFRANLKRADIT